MVNNKANYMGKCLDSFSYAFSALLELYGIKIEEFPDFDILSFRSFMFKYSQNVAEWFTPSIAWPIYMPMLMNNIRSIDSIIVCSAEDYLRCKHCFKEWVLIGETINPVQMKSVQNQFYTGSPSFFLCKHMEDNKYMICDPLGDPCSIIEEENLFLSMQYSEGFTAYIEAPVNLNVLPAEVILKKAIIWRNQNQMFNIAKHAEECNYIYQGKTKEKIALKYGLMNYQIQTEKNLNYLLNVGMIDNLIYKETRSLLQHINDIGTTCDFYLISKIEDCLWSALEERR